MSRPKAASSAILTRDGRYLLVLRSNPPSQHLYAFPGGRAEPGESPEQTALREFFEETGIVAHSPTLFETYDLPTRNADGSLASHFFLSVFTVEADTHSIAVAGDDAGELGWFTAEEVYALPIPDSVRVCVEKLEARR